MPARPGAWLTTVAKNRAIDRLRHERMKAQRLQAASAELSEMQAAANEDPMQADGDSGIEDPAASRTTACG